MRKIETIIDHPSHITLKSDNALISIDIAKKHGIFPKSGDYFQFQGKSGLISELNVHLSGGEVKTIYPPLCDGN